MTCLLRQHRHQDEVIQELRESFETARQLGNPTSMQAASREMARINGYGQPTAGTVKSEQKLQYWKDRALAIDDALIKLQEYRRNNLNQSEE